jgi:hypothetical protein
MKREEIEIKNFIELLRIIGSNTFKIKLWAIKNLGNKIKLKFIKGIDVEKIYVIETDRIEGQNLKAENEYIASVKFDENKREFVLSLMPVEKHEKSEIKPFEIDKTSSIEENFEDFVDYMLDEINERLKGKPEKIKYFTSFDYLRPFVEDFVNKIQIDWIYANLDSRLAVKSFALYLAKQKGLNTERFKYLKEEYINIDIMLGTIILKQKILDKYVKSYL